MQHVKDQREVLEKLKFYLKRIQECGFYGDTLNNIFRDFIPRTSEGILYASYDLSHLNSKSFEYDPTIRKINVSSFELKSLVNFMVERITEKYDIESKNVLGSYLCLLVMVAEIEKVYEHLMALDCVDAPCVAVRDGYKALFSLFDNDSIENTSVMDRAKKSYSLYVYRKNSLKHVIDRNAYYESINLINNLAINNKDLDINKPFEKMKNSVSLVGYHRDNKGCFDHTFKDLAMRNYLACLKQSGNMSMPQRIEYGLEIDDLTRKELLAKSKGR